MHLCTRKNAKRLIARTIYHTRISTERSIRIILAGRCTYPNFLPVAIQIYLVSLLRADGNKDGRRVAKKKNREWYNVEGIASAEYIRALASALAGDRGAAVETVNAKSAARSLTGNKTHAVRGKMYVRSGTAVTSP